MSADQPRLYPVFADLRDRSVIVVGGGAVAARKIAALLGAGADVGVVAAMLGDEVRRWARSGRIRHLARQFQPAQLDGAWLAIAATDDAALNAQVARAAGERRIWTNVVDDAALSAFHVPAVIDRAPLQIAISSGGAAPVLARQLRGRLEAMLDESIGPLAALLARWRDRIRTRLPDLATRRRFMERLDEGDVGTALRRADPAAAERALANALDGAQPQSAGFVSVVGAGPGDPGLVTLKAQRRLQEADVILHDRLVSREVLALARRDAELIETGKESGNHHTTQERIHALLLEHARAGRRVVRLKGGDPFVFGRGGEELEFLQAHGIAYEVVPGITAALACAAHAGVPLTHRDHAQSVRFVTAHCRNSLDTLDWSSLAQERQTLAVYMGVAGLDGVAARLIEHGRAASTPCALVENGSLPQQRTVLGTLANIGELARAHEVVSPALLIIGEVAALAATLHWYGDAPLVELPEGAHALPVAVAA